MCAESTVPEYKPKFQTPWVGKEKPIRTFGLRVHPEEVKRVDAFRSAFPDGGKMRPVIEEALFRAKEGRPEGVSDREYFEVLGRMLMARELLEPEIVRRISAMPASVQGDAYRVALEAKERHGGAYALREFNSDLVMDAAENVPGEKEEQVMVVVRRHVQRAQMEGKIMRGGQGLVYDFGEKLGRAEPELVNLLYYGQDSVEKILNASSGMNDFLMASASVRGWMMGMAEQIVDFKWERRLDALREFAEDLGKAVEENPGMDGNDVARMIADMPHVYQFKGPAML